MFTSPLTDHGTKNYSTIAFEADLPAIESAQDNPPVCDRNTGANCVNPPSGAAFYPIYSTTSANGTCQWQEGGPFIPGTINDFGGTSTSEYGPLLQTVFPAAGPMIIKRFENFNSGNMRNPCPGKGAG